MVLALLMGALPFAILNASAASNQVIESGMCGTDAIYELYSDGELVISGSGNINDRAFEGRNDIKYVVINEEITGIGLYTFKVCSNLEGVIFPNSVTSFAQDDPFLGCAENLTYIGFEENIYIKTYADGYGHPFIALQYCGDDAVYALLPDGTLLISGSGEIWNDAFSFPATEFNHVIIGHGITRIGDRAFFGCVDLESVTIPDSVISIGYSAFGLCTSLKSIIIPDSVTRIEDNTFGSCSYLESITIPDSVTSIGDNAFGLCTSLCNITIPDSVTRIDENAFWNCGVNNAGQWILTITGHKGSEAERYATANNIFFIDIDSDAKETGRCGDKATYRLYDEGVLVVSGSGAIWDYFFYASFEGTKRDTIKCITIEDGITSIGYHEFVNCDNLGSITIPNSLTSIAEYAFFSCNNLASVTIPDTVTSIAENAFNDCSDDLTITCYRGSVADCYAQAHNFETQYINDIYTAITVANGNIWLIIAIAVLVLGGVVAFVIYKKKKRPALADGETTEEEIKQ